MNRHILPLVMIASLSTLVSCGIDKRDTVSENSSIQNTAVTGSVQTIASGVLITQGTQTGGIQVPSTSASVLTRTETISYDSKTPEGMVEIEFSVSVKDGIITTASATPKTDKQGSRYNQDAFVKELSTKVVGKKAKDLDVDAIGGASLTTDAFETFVHSF